MWHLDVNILYLGGWQMLFSVTLICEWNSQCRLQMCPQTLFYYQPAWAQTVGSCRYIEMSKISPINGLTDRLEVADESFVCWPDCRVHSIHLKEGLSRISFELNYFHILFNIYSINMNTFQSTLNLNTSTSKYCLLYLRWYIMY